MFIGGITTVSAVDVEEDEDADDGGAVAEVPAFLTFNDTTFFPVTVAPGWGLFWYLLLSHKEELVHCILMFSLLDVPIADSEDAEIVAPSFLGPFDTILGQLGAFKLTRISDIVDD